MYRKIVEENKEWINLIWKKIDEKSKNRTMNVADSFAKTYNPEERFFYVYNGDKEVRSSIGSVVNLTLSYSNEKESPQLREQAWKMYENITRYIHTREKDYLDAAKKSADCFIADVFGNGLNECNFRSYVKPVIYDSSAYAIAACGFIEIAKAVLEYDQMIYINAALNLLKVLEKNRDWSDEGDTILHTSTDAHKARQKYNNIPITCGDYYFTEAMCKLKEIQKIVSL